MNKIRARVDNTVKDEQTAEALKPWYRQFCKRPTFNDDYLETFNRANVELIDTSDCHGVERISKNGVVANGVEYEVDCITYATGFEIGTSFRRRVDFEIRGQNGQSLFDHWAQGMRTFHGHSSRGFPNWFFVGIGQNGLSVNMTAMFDDQARHIAYIVREARDRGANSVQPRAEAEAAWVAEIRSLSATNTAFLEACTPGYYNSEGKFGEVVSTIISDAYAPGVNAFNALLAEWRANGDLEGLELVT
jgi:cyclohexanone monooxygenase